jgi:hypothetical protein
MVGYGIIVISFCCSSLYFISEEYIMGKYGLDPFWMTGVEGVMGIIVSLVIIPIISAITCTFTRDKCVVNNDGFSVMESFPVYFQ